jgi:ADP-ribose pyrophosphatase YjhB (NUDIX family)
MYNIRVYGLLIEQNSVLVSDELYNGIYMTKFPGGGHEIGEGLIACLQREFMEELQLEIKIKEHFYTTDYYIPSFFNKSHQLISIYYLIERDKNSNLKTSIKKFDFDSEKATQSLRWLAINELDEDDLTYPIDKKVVGMLKKTYYL